MIDPLSEITFSFLEIDVDGGTALFVVEEDKNPVLATEKETMLYQHILFLQHRIKSYQKAIVEIIEEE